MARDLNYITILKRFYPKIGISSYLDANDYSTISFTSNGENIPTKQELDILLSKEDQNLIIPGEGEILRTFFAPIGILSGTSIIPIGNVTPLITQGSPVTSITITPRLLSSKFSFSSSFIADSSTNNRNIVIALFRDSTCIYSSSTNLLTSGRPTNLSIEFVDAPSVLTPITYSLRVGVSAKATWYLNQLASGFSNGGTTKSILKISEYS